MTTRPTSPIRLFSGTRRPFRPTRAAAWRISRADADSFEAIATSRLFGFQDDIVIRVRPDGTGTSRVDMRSKSRDGKGDRGVNAARIRAYMVELARAQ